MKYCKKCGHIKIEKNPADDHSFEEVKRMIADVHYLRVGIENRMEKIISLERQIGSEKHRLTENGYCFKNLNVFIINGMEK
jgi:hypothetical protein